MKNNFGELINILGESRVSIKEPLLKYSSFKIGGPADLFYRAKNQNELLKAVKSAKDLEIPFFIFSGGTNLLISDSGFKGLVIKNDTSDLKIAGVKGKKISNRRGIEIQYAYVEADSGIPINRLVRFTIDQGFAGLEMFLGQPGAVGGAVYINAHNVNQNCFFGEFVESAEIIDREGNIKKVSKNYFRFGYDRSILQSTHETLLSVVIKLDKGNKEELWRKAQEALTYRQQSQPLGVFTSGCTFRNINLSDAIRLSTPSYTCSAGYLIDQAGLKGVSAGGAKFSDKHANFIINFNNAKASDVIKLINDAKEKVKEKFAVNLKEEIVLVGDFNYE